MSHLNRIFVWLRGLTPLALSAVLVTAVFQLFLVLHLVSTLTTPDRPVTHIVALPYTAWTATMIQHQEEHPPNCVEAVTPNWQSGRLDDELGSCDVTVRADTVGTLIEAHCTTTRPRRGNPPDATIAVFDRCNDDVLYTILIGIVDVRNMRN